MNPEEEFALMRNHEAWKVEPLAARATGARPSRWKFVVPVLAAAVVATLIVVGVNSLRGPNLAPSVTPPTPTSQPTSGETPTPTAAPVVLAPWSNPPQQVFAGDCTKVFTAEAASRLLGVDVTPLDAWSARPGLLDNTFAQTAVIDHNGGLQCAWMQHPYAVGNVEATLPNPRMFALVMPDALIDEDAEHPVCHRAQFESASCLSVSRAGLRYVIWTFDVNIASFDVAAITAEATGGTIPGIWKRRAEDWPATVDCSKLAADFAIALGNGSYNGGPQSLVGETPVTAALATGHGSTSCSFKSEHENESAHVSHLSVDVISGGAWLETAISGLPGSEELNITGTDNAFVRTVAGDPDYTMTYVISGENLLVINGPEVITGIPGLISALDAL